MDPTTPFKIKPGLNPLKEAKRVFGPPHEIHSSQQTSSTELGWRLHDFSMEADLTISYTEGGEHLGITLNYRSARTGVGSGAAQRENSVTERLARLVNLVKKPWEDWTEHEIMESPVWMALHREETGSSTPAIETKMVMLSFEKPDDSWVKRYFGKP